MRFSNLFAQTLRETPSDAELASHRLSLRAGLIRQLAAGIYSYLPLGWRALRKVEAIVREEMDAVGGQEISMPIVQPADLWRASGRYDAATPGPTLVRFRDRSSHDMVLAMTHEEAVTDLARQVVHSYKQLPLMVYQIQTKFRDETRARGGLVRVREFPMKDAYSFHLDAESLDATYREVYGAYERIFARCGLEAFAVEADPGMMGGATSHEFMVANEKGEDTLMRCARCGHAANRETARFDKGTLPAEEPAPLERVATPGATTIEAVAKYLGIETRQTLKAVFYTTAGGEVIFGVIRGDLEVNETKLAAALGGADLHPSTTEELEAAGLVAGYASPVGIEGVRVVADDSTQSEARFVAGANEPGYHLRNVNVARDLASACTSDWQSDRRNAIPAYVDIALAREGDPCPRCGAPLAATRGIEAGHVFQLGTQYSEKLGATVLNREGRAEPMRMGCYGIGLGRLLALVIEAHHDEQGIVWPVAIAPAQVHIVSVGANREDVSTAADALYERLCGVGYEVLYDDRPERAGVKFNDADLIGLPVRITISRRMLEGDALEIKARWEDEQRVVPAGEIEASIDALL